MQHHVGWSPSFASTIPIDQLWTLWPEPSLYCTIHSESFVDRLSPYRLWAPKCISPSNSFRFIGVSMAYGWNNFFRLKLHFRSAFLCIGNVGWADDRATSLSCTQFVVHAGLYCKWSQRKQMPSSRASTNGSNRLRSSCTARPDHQIERVTMRTWRRAPTICAPERRPCVPSAAPLVSMLSNQIEARRAPRSAWVAPSIFQAQHTPTTRFKATCFPIRKADGRWVWDSSSLQ